MSAENEYYETQGKDENNQFAHELEQLLAQSNGVDLDAASTKAIEEHHATGLPLAVCAFKYGLPLQDPRWWGECDDLNEDFYDHRIDLIGGYQNPLVDMAKAVAAAIQFPLNTTFLHAVGVLSTTTINRFRYKSRYSSYKHAGLFTMAAQPPSTGKSPTNGHLTNPIIRAVDELNEKNKPMRMILAVEIDGLEKDLKSTAKKNGRREIAETIIDKKKNLELVNAYEWGVTDATAEALEDCSSKQRGRFSIVSDEAEAVSVVFGLNYSNGTANLGFMLKGFDGGNQKTLRMGRQGYSGEVFGSVAVLAQESTVATILRTGRSDAGSRGMCERFLLLNEPNIIHEKDHRNYQSIPYEVEKNYKHMIGEIINTEIDTVLEFSEDSIEYVIQFLEGMQKHISDGGKFANELMRGVIGKSDTQIYKIATTLHIAKEWSIGGSKSLIIQIKETEAAVKMYLQLIKSFMDVAETEGIAGQTLEMRVAAKRLSAIISDQRKPRTCIKHPDFSDGLKNTSPFSKVRGIRKHLKTNLLPAMQSAGYIVFDEKNLMIYINPKLKE